MGNSRKMKDDEDPKLKGQAGGEAQSAKQREAAKARAAELEELNIHGSAEHPIPGSQAWADKHGLK